VTVEESPVAELVAGEPLNEYCSGDNAQAAPRFDGSRLKWLIDNFDNIRKLIDLFGGIGTPR
jgi:hypothetical protein